jgi:hypothetical protein
MMHGQKTIKLLPYGCPQNFLMFERVMLEKEGSGVNQDGNVPDFSYRRTEWSARQCGCFASTERAPGIL